MVNQMASGNEKTATYQLVWATDEAGKVSYVIFNYYELGFSSNDVSGSNNRGMCKVSFSVSFEMPFSCS